MSSPFDLALWVLWVLCPVLAIFIPALVEKRLMRLMTLRAPAAAQRESTARLPEVRSATRLDYDEYSAAAPMPGAASARQELEQRWIALFRKAFWADLAACGAYAVLPALAVALTGVPGAHWELGLLVVLVYLVLAVTRYFLHFPSFSIGDGQLGASREQGLDLVVSMGQAGSSPLGWPSLVLRAIRVVSMPRYRLWLTGFIIVICLHVGIDALRRPALYDTDIKALYAALVLAALAHAGLTLHLFIMARQIGGPHLLVLRVFGVHDNTPFTFGKALAVWRMFGPYFTVIDHALWRHEHRKFTAGAVGRMALLVFTVYWAFKLMPLLLGPASVWEPVAVLAFVLAGLTAYAWLFARLLEADFIRDKAQLVRSLAQLERWPRGIDLGFRSLEVPCYDDTWKLAVDEFLKRADVILMDLRGFSAQRLGCEYEVNVLMDAVPIERVVFLVEAGGDHLAVDALLQECWRQLAATSPNHGRVAPKARVFLSRAGDNHDVRSLLGVLVQAARSGIQQAAD